MRFLMVSCFYPPYHVGGACMHVYYLANLLARKGHKVDVLYSSDCYRLIRKNPTGKYLNHDNVRLMDINTSLGKFEPLLSYMFAKSSSMIKKVLTGKYDIIHYHNISLFGPKVFEFGKAKKIYTAHDHWLFCPLNDLYRKGRVCSHKQCNTCAITSKRPPQFWRSSKLMKKALENLDAVICPSRYMADFLGNNGLKNNFFIVPNFVPKSNKQIFAKEGFYLYAGMLEEFKGIKELIATFKENRRTLIIAGEGSLSGYVKKQKSENIKYLGWVDKKKLDRLYSSSKAVILPSKCPENSPNVILEAMALGTPTIGSNIGGIPEILEEIDRNLVFDNSLTATIDYFENQSYDPEYIMEIHRSKYSSEAYYKRYMDIVTAV